LDEESLFAVGTGSKIPAGELKQEILSDWGGGSLFSLGFDVCRVIFIGGVPRADEALPALERVLKRGFLEEREIPAGDN